MNETLTKQNVLTVQDAHELEPRVSEKAIRKACRAGELPNKYHGRFFLFMREDFDKWLVEFMAK